MERLTFKGTGIKSGEDKEYDCTIINPTMLTKALIKLREYEDLEEQGLLHKAPLKNGTPICFFRYNFEDGEYLEETEYVYGLTENWIGELGKDYWLSVEDALLANEEAEEKLKELLSK